MFKVNEHVRVKGMRMGSPDEFARIAYIKEDGVYFVTNMNMPYQGTINQFMTEDKIEKIRR
jgi:hypothetical protein